VLPQKLSHHIGSFFVTLAIGKSGRWHSLSEQNTIASIRAP